MNSWKQPILLITGIGMSHLGNWIYFIALNITILNLTGSAAAVAGLFVIRPIAMLLTNTWSGSVIDRVNKRKLMIIVDVVRGVLIFILPFLSSIWMIYALILVINIFGSFFGPSSSVYITKLVPEEKRQRFNSIMSMTSSGAFLLGPALSGVLIMSFGTEICIFINAISFFVCAFFIFLLPNVDEDLSKTKARERIHIKTIQKDWQTVRQFAKSATYFIGIFLLFQIALVFGFAVDSQEAPFIKQHLQLSDKEYGFMVSVTGIGSLTGSFFSAILAKRISIRAYISFGMLFTTISYGLFYASFGFISATISFVVLGFFMAFANSGYATFFQKNIPTEIMGRFASITDMFQAMIQISLTLLLGLFAELFSLQLVCLLFCMIAIVSSIILCIRTYKPSKIHFYV